MYVHGAYDVELAAPALLADNHVAMGLYQLIFTAADNSDQPEVFIERL